ncbi:hypothetical protein PR048_007785 [Dryococelus australis]|uniref:Uncharacterized protein n=1 Tax=Dryococelus australis TaxID=614101 RepID=A0ABQ9HV84_9NEOP|nr:hypothetical protein PR048_007785 [Dryococelus australis]
MILDNTGPELLRLVMSCSRGDWPFKSTSLQDVVTGSRIALLGRSQAEIRRRWLSMRHRQSGSESRGVAMHQRPYIEYGWPTYRNVFCHFRGSPNSPQPECTKPALAPRANVASPRGETTSANVAETSAGTTSDMIVWGTIRCDFKITFGITIAIRRTLSAQRCLSVIPRLHALPLNKALLHKARVSVECLHHSEALALPSVVPGSVPSARILRSGKEEIAENPPTSDIVRYNFHTRKFARGAINWRVARLIDGAVPGCLLPRLRGQVWVSSGRRREQTGRPAKTARHFGYGHRIARRAEAETVSGKSYCFIQSVSRCTILMVRDQWRVVKFCKFQVPNGCKEFFMYAVHKLTYNVLFCDSKWGHGGVVVILLASHQEEPGSIPGEVVPVYLHVGIVPDDADGWRGSPPLPLPFHSGAAPRSPHFTLIGSQDFDVKSRPTLFTNSLHSLHILEQQHSCPVAPSWFETRPKIGSKIEKENCCTIRAQSWTGDRNEVHFEPPLKSRSEISSHRRQISSVGRAPNSGDAAGQGLKHQIVVCCSSKAKVPNSGAAAGQGLENPMKKFHDTRFSGGGGVVVRLLAPYLCEPGEISGRAASGFSHVGIVQDDAACRRVLSGISRFPCPCIPALLRTHLVSSTSALKTVMSRAVQISPLHDTRSMRGWALDERGYRAWQCSPACAWYSSVKQVCTSRGAARLARLWRRGRAGSALCTDLTCSRRTLGHANPPRHGHRHSSADIVDMWGRVITPDAQNQPSGQLYCQYDLRKRSGQHLNWHICLTYKNHVLLSSPYLVELCARHVIGCKQTTIQAGPRWCNGQTTRRTGFDSRRGHSQIYACGNCAGRCRWSAGFLGNLPLPRPCIPALLHAHFASPSSTLKASMSAGTYLKCSRQRLLTASREGGTCKCDRESTCDLVQALPQRVVAKTCSELLTAAGQNSVTARLKRSNLVFDWLHEALGTGLVSDWLLHAVKSFLSAELPASELVTKDSLKTAFRIFCWAVHLCITQRRNWRGRGGLVVKLLAFHLGKPGSIHGAAAAPGFPHVGIVLDDAAVRRVFSGYLPFSPALSFRHCSVLITLHPRRLSRFRC